MTETGARSASAPVLLIEDEPAVMAYVRAALERNGYHVVTAESGADALQMLASGNFQGIVSDMRTPGGVDGHRFTPGSRTIVPNWHRKSWFITGDIANEETVAILRKTGAPCLEKPFRVQQFISVVEQTRVEHHE